MKPKEGNALTGRRSVGTVIYRMSRRLKVTLRLRELEDAGRALGTNDVGLAGHVEFLAIGAIVETTNEIDVAGGRRQGSF
jgi:hypothetical protein